MSIVVQGKRYANISAYVILCRLSVCCVHAPLSHASISKEAEKDEVNTQQKAMVDILSVVSSN
jgi:hypothetical protein